MNNINIVVLGVLISIIYYEITNISPGGIIVPGLFVLYFNQPERMIYTIIISIITYLIVKLLSKYIIIFGKRRFAFLIIISLFVNLIISLIIDISTFNLLSVSLIGYTISGLIANDIYKQGILKTITSLVIVTGILELIVLLN